MRKDKTGEICYNTDMANANPILYGVPDFVLMRTKGACYIDRAAYTRELEKTRYVMFRRPRRFGKSLLVSDYAARLPTGLAEKVLSAGNCHAKLNTLVTHLKGSDARFMVLIDEMV